MAGFRSGIAAVALALFLPGSLRRIRPRTLLVGCAYAGALVCYALANKLTTAASTIFLYSAAPLYVLFLGRWLLGERWGRRDLPFMAAIAAGLLLLLMGQPPSSATAPDPLAGNLLALGGGLFWALLVVGLRWLSRDGGERGDAAAAVIAGSVISFLFCLPAALPVVAAATRDWLIVGYLGVFQIGLAYVFLTAALRRVPAFEASLLIMVEPVLNPIWAWWLHGEKLGATALAGGALVLGATALRVGRRSGTGRRSAV